MKYILIFVFLMLVLVCIWALGSFIAVNGLEEPKYSLLSKENGYEIRLYEPYLIAETTVTGSYDESLNQGFRNIADYIFGNNTRASTIDTNTLVVESSSASEKIAMTVPVINEGDNTERTISFVMPSQYTLENIPKPNTDLVTLREIPERKVAVLRFGWYPNEKRVEDKKQKLAGLLVSNNIEIIGDYSSAYYNPPFSMPLLLRNEILVDIK